METVWIAAACLLVLQLVIIVTAEGDPNRYVENANKLAVPRFMPTNANLYHGVGEKAVLECAVENLGQKRVSWRKASTNQVLTVGLVRFVDDTRLEVEHPPSSVQWNLVIRDLRLEDAGVYECQVSSKVRHLRHHVTLLVKEQPKVEDQKKQNIQITGEDFVDEGEKIYLMCNATAKDQPPEDLDWFREGNRLQTSDTKGIYIRKSVTLSTGTIVSVLEIKHARLSDAGVYVCRTSSLDVTSFRVNVLNGDTFNVKRGSGYSEKDPENRGDKGDRRDSGTYVVDSNKDPLDKGTDFADNTGDLGDNSVDPEDSSIDLGDNGTDQGDDQTDLRVKGRDVLYSCCTSIEVNVTDLSDNKTDQKDSNTGLADSGTDQRDKKMDQGDNQTDLRDKGRDVFYNCCTIVGGNVTDLGDNNTNREGTSMGVENNRTDRGDNETDQSDTKTDKRRGVLYNCCTIAGDTVTDLGDNNTGPENNELDHVDNGTDHGDKTDLYNKGTADSTEETMQMSSGAAAEVRHAYSTSVLASVSVALFIYIPSQIT